MNYQTWYLTLTCLLVVSRVFECKEYLSSRQEISRGQNNQEGEDDVCCNSDLMQSIDGIFEQAEGDDYGMLVKNFNELKNGLEYVAPDEVQEEYIFIKLHNVACDVIMDSKYRTCSCDSPVVRKLVEDNMEKITRMYTRYTNEFSELEEILNTLNFQGEQPIEEGLIEKQLKDLVCKQCKGLRDPMSMLECQQLMNLGNTFEENRLEVMESVVKFIQVKVRTLSKQIQEISSATEHAKESLKETINQLIQTAADLNLTSCDEVFEAPNIDPELGASCATLPSKCNNKDKATCTINNCKDQCRVNCCNGAASGKCIVPTCKGCKNAAATDTCNANRANQCAGVTTDNGLNATLSEIYNLEIQIQEQDPDLGASCTQPPSKCVASNKASCTLNNCKDQCNLNCCNGAASDKCTIPTCKGCKNTAATATCNANRANQCAGLSTHKGLIEILNETYKLQDHIEELEIMIEVRGKNTCQRLMDTLEDANILEDTQREKGSYMNEIQDNINILLPDEMFEDINEVEF